ncbi:hypothetical protein [Microbulbifer variabilis]|uniref:hypothetical protein n=1 Tax=Microbulbifer variabilis TaxID=266805 RepID=UPI0003672F68|nr:hypothetical protein [Microbulbifer variabilis]
MNIEDRGHYLRTFENQLYDSVYLLYFAFDTDQDKYQDDVIRPFIRSSVINCILLLESASNCLIDSLDLSTQFYSDIEKLPTLSKFEYFLNKIKPDIKFDRGVHQIQFVHELKIIRDLYVHPKVKKSKWSKISENVWSADHGNTKQLKFPFDPSSWRREHAILALKSVNDFFNLYFLEWCAFSSSTVVDILLSRKKVDFNNPIGATIDCIGGLDRAFTEWGIDFKFIGKKL